MAYSFGNTDRFCGEPEECELEGAEECTFGDCEHCGEFRPHPVLRPYKPSDAKSAELKTALRDIRLALYGDLI